VRVKEIFPAGRFLIAPLVAGALIFLQLRIAGHDLLSVLPAYAILAVAAWIGVLYWRSDASPNRLCLWTALLFAGYVGLRALLSPDPYFARADLYAVLAALVLYGLAVTALSEGTQRLSLLSILLAFSICHVVIGLIQFGHGENFEVLPYLERLPVTKRAGGFYGNPDHLAGLLEILGILALSLTCWSKRPKWTRVLFGYLALNCFIGVTLTGSRGGYLSLAASLIVFGILSVTVLRAAGTSTFRTYGLIGLLILTGALITPVLLLRGDPGLKDRVATIVTADTTRFDLWRASITQWKLDPLFGTGSGTYRFYGRKFRESEMQRDPVFVHNDYLHLLCEYGLLGEVLFLAFLVAHLRHGWKSFIRLGPQRARADAGLQSDRLSLTIGALSAIGAYLFHSGVDFNMHIPANAMVVAFLFGLLSRTNIRSGEEPASPQREQIFRIAFATLAGILLIQSLRLLPGEYFAEQSRAALEDERPADAIRAGERSLQYDRKNPKVFSYLGRSQMALADQEPVHGKMQDAAQIQYYTGALNDFDAARRLSPMEEAYPVDMAFVLDQMNRFTESESLFDVARSLDPRSENLSKMYKAHLKAWAKSGSQGDRNR
jgi:O-antigen ligase